MCRGISSPNFLWVSRMVYSPHHGIYSLVPLAELSGLRNLEHLNIGKNQFRRLPVQLSECVRLNELNVSDNEALVHIPERISNLPMLQSLAADRKYTRVSVSGS